MRHWISCGLMISSLVFAMTCAPGLEPTAPGVASLLAALGLLVSGGARRLPWVCVLIVLLAAAYATWRMATSPVGDLARSDATLLATGVCGFLWAVSVPRKILGVFAGAILMVALANVGVGIWQWKVDPRFIPLYAQRKVDGFPCGFYGHYNHFANFLLGSGMLAAGMALAVDRKSWMRWVLAVIAGLCAVGVGISQSRGAYLGCVIGCVVLFVAWLLDLHRRRIRWMPAVAVAALAVTPVIAWAVWDVAPQVLSQRVEKGEVGSQSLLNDNGRFAMASMAVSVWQKYPLIGAGSRGYSYESFHFWDTSVFSGDAGDPEFAHQEWLQIAADYGLIGLLFMIAVWITIAMRGVMVVVMGKDDGASDFGVTLGALAGLAAMLVQSMFSFVFHVSADVLMCGVLLGAIASQPWPFKKRTERDSHALAVTGYGVLSVAVAIPAMVLTWRDVPAWFVHARPDLARVSHGPEETLRMTLRALEWRQDYRLEKRAARAATTAAQADSKLADEFADIALRHWQSAVDRHPYDYLARLSYAVALDECGRLLEAERYFTQLLPLLDVREKYYRARHSYGLHCARRGEALWLKRQPEVALAWFMEALRQIQFSKRLNWIGDQDEKWLVVAKIQRQIDFLQGARVTPNLEAVPQVPDPKRLIH